MTPRRRVRECLCECKRSSSLESERCFALALWENEIGRPGREACRMRRRKKTMTNGKKPTSKPQVAKNLQNYICIFTLQHRRQLRAPVRSRGESGEGSARTHSERHFVGKSCISFFSMRRATSSSARSYLARYVACERRAQERDRTGGIGCGPHATQRHGLADNLFRHPPRDAQHNLFATDCHALRRLRQPRVDKSKGDRVATDSKLSPLPRDRLRETYEPRLCGRVICLARISVHADGAADGKDASFARRAASFHLPV